MRPTPKRTAAQLAALAVPLCLTTLAAATQTAAPPAPDATQRPASSSPQFVPKLVGFTLVNASGVQIESVFPRIAQHGRVSGSTFVGNVEQAARTDQSGNSPQALGLLPSGRFSEGFSINSAGQVVGDGDTDVGTFDPQFETHAFRFTDGVGMEDLTPFELFGSSVAYGINADGDVAGTVDEDGDVSAFRFTDGIETLGSLGGNESNGRDINNDDQVCGGSALETTGVFHAFRFTDGPGMEDLGTLGGVYSQAYGINDSGDVAGESSIETGSALHAFRFANAAAEMQDLGVLSEGDSSTGFGINNDGDVVGTSQVLTDGPSPAQVVPPPAAFLYTDAFGMLDLNSLIPAGSGWSLEVATGINDDGQIVGVGHFNNKLAVFLLNPADVNPPVLSNCSVDPRETGPAGGKFDLNVHVTDDVGVDQVVAEVTPPGGDPVEVPCTLVSGDLYHGSFIAPKNTTMDPQVYGVLFAATDAVGNRGTLDCGTFTVDGDTQPPDLLDCSVDPRSLPASGGQVSLQVTAVDEIGVASVRAKIALPGGGEDDVALKPGSDNVYSGNYHAAPNKGAVPDVYGVTFEATDLAGNTAQLDCGSFTVNATGGPQIKNCNVKPRTLPSTGGVVQITATVTSKVPIVDVFAEILGPDDKTTTVPLTGQGDDQFAGHFTAPPNTTTSPQVYHVTVFADDELKRELQADCGNFTVLPGSTQGINSAIARLFRPGGQRPVATVVLHRNQRGAFRGKVDNLRPGRYRAEANGFASTNATGPVIATAEGFVVVKSHHTITIELHWQFLPPPG